MKVKLQKELLKTFTIDDIEFNIYGGEKRGDLGQTSVFCNDDQKIVNFTVYGWVNESFLEGYFKSRLSLYKSKIANLIRHGNHIKNWSEAKYYLAAFKRYEAESVNKEIFPIRKISEPSKPNNKLPDRAEICQIVKSEKGYSFHRVFACSLCNHTHSHGFSYLIRGHEICVCTYCRSDLRRLTGYIKIIPTNMGHGRKG